MIDFKQYPCVRHPKSHFAKATFGVSNCSCVSIVIVAYRPVTAGRGVVV